MKNQKREVINLKNKRKTNLWIAAALFSAFLLWTVLLLFVDAETIGPLGSSIGFATLNRYFHSLTGVHLLLYTVTDWLSLLPIGIMLGFAVLGAVQWIARKRIRLVDRSILLLGFYYAAVFAAYAFFEFVPINHRPILIDGRLEASYPSSTTLLVATVIPSAILWLDRHIAHAAVRKTVCVTLWVFTAFMIVARLVSGVHWLTDIIGGIFLSCAFMFALRAFWE